MRGRGDQKIEDTDLLELTWSGDVEVGVNRCSSNGKRDQKRWFTLVVQE